MVYGGGSIIPDIFIPADTSFNSKLYTNLIRKGIYNKYTVDYVMQYRDKLKQQYPDIETYNVHFSVDNDMINDIKALAEKEKVEWNDEEYQRSEQFIKLQTKALIARNIWDTQQYYQVTLTEDPALKKAMEILSDDRQYNKLLK